MKRENRMMGNATLATTILLFFLFAAAHPAAGNDSGDGSLDERTYTRYHDFVVAFDVDGNIRYATVYDYSEHPGDALASEALETNAIVVGGNGGVYLAGYYREISDYFGRVRNFDDSGQLNWTFEYSGKYALIADAESAPGGGVYLTGGRDGDYYTARLDHDSNVEWEDSYSAGAEYNFSRSYALVVDEEDSTFITGIQQQNTKSDIVTIKYDALGNRVWTASYPGDGNGVEQQFCTGHALAINRTGEVYVVGISAIDNDWDGLLIKYSTNGDELWVRTLDEPDHNIRVFALAFDSADNVVIVGERWEENRFPFIVKYDEHGTEIWSKKDGLNAIAYYPFHSSRVMAIDDQDNIYLTVSLTPSIDIFTYKISPAGEILWCVSDSHEGDSCAELILDDEMNVIVKVDNPCGYTKYDAQGNIMKQRQYTIEDPSYLSLLCDTLALDAEGNAFLAGSYWTERTEYYDDDNGDDDDEDDEDEDDDDDDDDNDDDDNDGDDDDGDDDDGHHDNDDDDDNDNGCGC
ncbi:MAG TPA: hypothetical protein PKW95_17090 [bacterium]|nr:hypothetical protein [bacterium]